jgi:hypothetical protein
MITMVMPAVLGCGGTTTPPPRQAFELDGQWTYLGPSDGPHDLTIALDSMIYTDVAGMWSSRWTITSYDNALHEFQIAFVSGSGTYLPVGQNMSGTYDLKDKLLTTQLANGIGSYPPLQAAGTCTNGTDGAPVPDCRLYIMQN